MFCIPNNKSLTAYNALWCSYCRCWFCYVRGLQLTPHEFDNCFNALSSSKTYSFPPVLFMSMIKPYDFQLVLFLCLYYVLFSPLLMATTTTFFNTPNTLTTFWTFYAEFYPVFRVAFARRPTKDIVLRSFRRFVRYCCISVTFSFISCWICFGYLWCSLNAEKNVFLLFKNSVWIFFNISLCYPVCFAPYFFIVAL